MPKYLDPEGVAYLWRKIKNNLDNKMIYYSKKKSEWDLNRDFISQKNVLYIYSDYKTLKKDEEQILIPGLKIGDGTSYLIDLPFVNSTRDNEIDQMILNHINNNIIHISSEERDFWNNKLNLSLYPQTETLILNRN